ncbi:LPXTG cell wall anchor domain-containing protein, partial [uncultured Thomasclavelia sp.]|uniref:LPXTG cell wall anchor domain-containing protein n=1 Tax=uncultured Thomasclavelia sp. TaxID=3025759 RepID=UPI00260084A7
SDDKYKLSLFETTADDKLMFAEDYDQDGVDTLVTYSNHWSWIYTLNNIPQDSDGTHIWDWAVNYQAAKQLGSMDTTDTNIPNQTTSSVKTGDDINLGLLGGIALLSVLGTVVAKRRVD